MSSDIEWETVLNSLFSVENVMKTHYHSLQSTIESQRDILYRMLVISQRYTIVTRGLPCKRTFPAEVSLKIDDEIRKDFYMQLKNLNESNSKLTSSLSTVKEAFNELTRVLAELGITSTYRSDIIEPPITHCFELFADALKFFNQTHSNLKCFASLLKPGNLSSLERYQGLLQKNSDFNDHFLKSLAYCSYLHTNKKTKT